MALGLFLLFFFKLKASESFEGLCKMKMQTYLGLIYIIYQEWCFMDHLPRNRARFCLRSSLFNTERSPGAHFHTGAWAEVHWILGEIRGAELIVIV